MRGINRQNIFEEDEDRLYFMNVLKRCKEISGFKLYAFALMSNHVHLLIEPAGESLDMVFRRIGTRYAKWYNQKYQRIGHLFQDRFRSENVENDLYFMTVLRYILQNPMKAGLETRLGNWRWSSFLAYEKEIGAVTDTRFALELFGGRENLIRFLGQDNDDTALDEADCDQRLKNDLAKEKMARITQCASVSDFQQLDRSVQKEFARKMYHEGVSLSQISRMTGISRPTVYRIVKEPDQQNEEELLLHESGPDLLAYHMNTEVI